MEVAVVVVAVAVALLLCLCCDGGGGHGWRAMWLFIVGREGARRAASWPLECSRGQMPREMAATGQNYRSAHVVRTCFDRSVGALANSDLLNADVFFFHAFSFPSQIFILCSSCHLVDT